MKKMMAISVASAMLLTMGTAAAADIQMGLVSEEKLSWPQDFGFGQQLVVLRGEEAIEQEMDKAMELQPQDEIYIPLYYTTAEGESITVGASKEQMSGHVPYTGEIDKNWKLNLVDRSKQLIEDAQFYLGILKTRSCKGVPCTSRRLPYRPTTAWRNWNLNWAFTSLSGTAKIKPSSFPSTAD